MSGTKVRHAKRGPGTIFKIMPDGRRAVLFNDGEVHRYAPSKEAPAALTNHDFAHCFEF